MSKTASQSAPQNGIFFASGMKISRLSTIIAVIVGFMSASTLSALAQTLPSDHSTITLKSLRSGDYVSADATDGFRLEANIPTVDSQGEATAVTAPERFKVEPVEGLVDTFRLKSAENGTYGRVNPDKGDKLYADGTPPSDPSLAYFRWQAVDDTTVNIWSVGGDAYIKVSGSAQTPRARSTTPGDTDTHFEWDVVQPNLVLVYVDDWAWNGSTVRMDEDMANSGFNGEFPTLAMMPNLEAMAAEGLVFRNAYGSPQCSPARAALQTGQSNARNGFTVYMSDDSEYDTRDKYEQRPVIGNGSDLSLDPNTPTLANTLTSLGYATGMIGKWHLRNDARIDRALSGPQNAGFTFAPDGDTTNEEGDTVTTDYLPVGDGSDAATHPDYYQYGPKRTQYITDTGNQFITDQVAEGTPFLSIFSYYAMHTPYECLPSSRALFQDLPQVLRYNERNNGFEQGDNPATTLKSNQDPAVWLGMLYEIDLSIGEIRQTLVDQKVEDNTYFVVVSDNGYRHSFFDDLTGQPQPLHSQKWFLWEGGIRTPMVFSGPGIPANSTTLANIANYDLMPTFVELAAGSANAIPAEVEGVSLAQLIKGETTAIDFAQRSLYFHFPPGLPSSAIIKGNHKGIYFYETPVRWPGRTPIMLFDLAADINETTNLYGDPNYPNSTQIGDDLANELLTYLQNTATRDLPIPNDGTTFPNFPVYDATAYLVGDPDNGIAPLITNNQVRYSPFEGTRELQNDEIDSTGAFEAEQYDSASGVSTVAAQDEGGGSALSAVGDGDWIEYDGFEVLGEGTYTVNVRIAGKATAGVPPGTIDFSYGGQFIGSVDVNATGGKQVWETFSSTITFPALSGPQTLRLETSHSANTYRINWFTFEDP